jgi:hypothetical protein
MLLQRDYVIAAAGVFAIVVAKNPQLLGPW